MLHKFEKRNISLLDCVNLFTMEEQIGEEQQTGEVQIGKEQPWYVCDVDYCNLTVLVSNTYACIYTHSSTVHVSCGYDFSHLTM